MMLNLSGMDCKELKEVFRGIENAIEFEKRNQQKLWHEYKRVERQYIEMFRKLTSLRATADVSSVVSSVSGLSKEPVGQTLSTSSGVLSAIANAEVQALEEEVRNLEFDLKHKEDELARLRQLQLKYGEQLIEVDDQMRKQGC